MKPVETERFSEEERNTLYRIVRARRDMRHFRSDATVEGAVLQRVLQAAHQAPSVGLMQPWRFVRIRDTGLRSRIAAMVERERQKTAAAFDARRAEFLRLKLEGVRECAELIAVVLAPDDGTLLGRRTMPADMALCSAACAIQNLWLAARAENLGLGWVSLFEPTELAALLNCPPDAKPIALLCLGPVEEFYARPMLEETGWREGRPMETAVFDDMWPGEATADERARSAGKKV